MYQQTHLGNNWVYDTATKTHIPLDKNPQVRQYIESIGGVSSLPVKPMLN